MSLNSVSALPALKSSLYASFETLAVSQRAERDADALQMLVLGGLKAESETLKSAISGGAIPVWIQSNPTFLPRNQVSYQQTPSGVYEAYVSYRSAPLSRDGRKENAQTNSIKSDGFTLGFDAGRFEASSDPVGLLISAPVPAISLSLEFPGFFEGSVIGLGGSFYDLTDPDYLAHSARTGLASYAKGELWFGSRQYWIAIGSGIFRSRGQAAESGFVIRHPRFAGISAEIWEGQPAIPLQRVVYHHLTGFFESENFSLRGALYLQSGSQAAVDSTGTQQYFTKKSIKGAWALAFIAEYDLSKWRFAASGAATSRHRESVDDLDPIGGFSALRGQLEVAGGLSSIYLNSFLPDQQSHGLIYTPFALPDRFVQQSGRPVRIQQQSSRFIPDYRNGGIRIGGPAIYYKFTENFEAGGLLNYAELREGRGAEGILSLQYSTKSFEFEFSATAAAYRASEPAATPANPYENRVRTEWFSRYIFSMRYFLDFS